MANPKLAGMKSLLLRAWRERWPDVQWSINVKKLLSPSSGGQDNAQLAELLLSQALIGSSPNNLVLSYLKHAMCTQMVPCAAVIKSIVHYDDISKPYCMRSLLDVIAEFAGRVSLKGTSEDSLTLAHALLTLVKWLAEIIYRSVQRFSEDRQAMEYQTLVDRASELIRVLIETPTSCALLHIARLEDPDLFTEIEQAGNNIIGLPQSVNINSNIREKLDASLRLLTRIQTHSSTPTAMMDVSHQTLNISINVLLNIEAVLNPTNQVQPFVEQLLVIEQVQGMQRCDLYCEMLRTCLLGSIDAAKGKGEEINWAAFAFLKLPQALVELMQSSNDANKQKHLEKAFDKLLQYAALLNLADSKCKCDWLSTLLNELTKYSLLPEAKVNAIIQKRQADGSRPRHPEVLATQPSPTLILRAEPTVNSILKFRLTLDADYSKNQDALLGVLCHMLSGKSFALILTAAAARGKLHSFAAKLIKFNEFAKQTPGKSAQTSALLFDITFLMLCHIVQEYGIEVIMSSVESTDSFFVQWATHCLPDENKYRSLDLHPFKDQAKVDMLLQQFNSGGEIKANPLRWHEVCQNIPYAVYEVLIAWECGVLTADQVKGILDNVKGRMCCLPVVVSTWFCSYIYTIDEEHRKKPLSILSMLSKPVQPDTSNQYYHERSHLMVAILTKMVQEVVPNKAASSGPSTVLPRTQPARTMLLETYQSVFSNSCIDTKDIQKFEYLLGVAGPRWFCEQLVREVLSQSRVEDINKGVSLVLSLFHLDLESLTICLLHHVLPGMLHGSGNNLTLLTDPRGRALAQLSVMCLITTHKMRTTQKADSSTLKRRESRKRSRPDIEFDEADDISEEFNPRKLRRLASSDEGSSLQYEGFNLGELLGSKEKSEPVPAYDTKDPLNKALVNLLSLFLHIVSCSQVSQKTGFVMAFIEETVNAGPETTKFVLKFMPLTLVSQLMKCLPAQFNTELLLSVSDLSTTMGRKVAAKVVCQNARFAKVSSHQSQE